MVILIVHKIYKKTSLLIPVIIIIYNNNDRTNFENDKFIPYKNDHLTINYTNSGD